MSGKESDSPRRTKKKKEKKEKKAWPLRNPVTMIFQSKEKGERERRGTKGEECKKEEPETSNSNQNNMQLRPTVRSEQLNGKPVKPSPLLRPRSIHTMKGNLLHEAASIETVENPENRVKPQFGLHPTELAEQYPNEPIPAILIECVEILKNDIMKEGVFRIPGRMGDIIEMKLSFEQGNGLNVKDPDTYAIAGLLAQFFRELPEPLLMYSLYTKWIDAVKQEAEEAIKERIIDLLKELPEPNYNILKYFTSFLTQVGKHSGANRMGPRNLALVFGASLLNPPSIDQYDLDNIKLQCNVIEYLIRFYSYFFEGKEENSPSSASKSQPKQIATIPAGLAKPSQPQEDKRAKNRFIKRKTPFFSSTQQSSLTQAAVQSAVSSMDLDSTRRKTQGSGKSESCENSDSDSNTPPQADDD